MSAKRVFPGWQRYPCDVCYRPASWHHERGGLRCNAHVPKPPQCATCGAGYSSMAHQRCIGERKRAKRSTGG
jgi:hypothetical protein